MTELPNVGEVVYGRFPNQDYRVCVEYAFAELTGAGLIDVVEVVDVLGRKTRYAAGAFWSFFTRERRSLC